MEDEDEVDIVGGNQEDILLPDAGGYDGMGLNLAELLPELGPSSWLLSCNQNWNLDGDLEVKSKIQPEPALKREETCVKLNEDSLESAKTQRHRKYWSDTEKELFTEGFKRFGNKWSKISKLLGTRTTLQVKSFARQFLKQGTLVDNEIEKRKATEEFDNHAWQEHHSDTVNKVEISLVGDQHEDLIIKVPENDSSSSTTAEVVRLHRENSWSDSEEVDIEGIAEDRDDEPPPIQEEIKFEDETSEIVAYPHDVFENHPVDERTSQDSTVCDELKEFADDLQSPDGATFHFTVPEKELVVERNVISPNEKLVHPEFFQGRPQKTPERYLRIRNYILDSWEKCKPSYLNKTSVRPGLKNCGDVNCIGRIHTYLEQTGAINFGCEQTVYNQSLLFDGSKKLSFGSTNKKSTIFALSKQFERTETMRPRKRKVLDASSCSENCDYTIKHGDNGEIVDVASVIKAPKRKRQSTNPFHLLLCAEFSPEKPAPFSVEVDVKAAFRMDIHAHLSKLEVIGLLGGHYDFNTSTLHVLRAEPCRSISTGLECEMDPVSQTIASEKLQHEGFSIVGWYHSHPTFAPNPSIRDLDTQTKFQHWFSKGGTPFLGVIISPHIISSPFSKFRYLVVDTDSVPNTEYHQPFKFSPTFVWEEENDEDDYNTISFIKTLLETSDEFKMSLSSVKKIISGFHRHLVTAGIENQTRTAVLSSLGKQLVEIANSEEQTSTQEHLFSTEFTDS